MNTRFHKSWLFMILLVCGVSSAFSVSSLDVFRIPRIEGLTIDGNGNDWGSRGFYVAILTDPDGNTLPAEDFDVSFRVGWDDRGLFVFLRSFPLITHRPNR